MIQVGDTGGEYVFSLSEIGKISILLKSKLNLQSDSVVLFYGGLGAGKTTLIKSLFKELGVKDVVKSPTYNIQNEYYGLGHVKIFHWDLYRVSDEESSEMLSDFLGEKESDARVLVVEWAERLGDLKGDFFRIILEDVCENDLFGHSEYDFQCSECRKITIKCP